MSIRHGRLLAFVAALAASTAVTAQPFPSHPIKLVVPYAAGGNIDITARVAGQALGDALGQPVVVENRPGAGGLLGAANVAKSTPDGYTLLLGSSGSITIAPAVSKNVTFDPVKDFTPIGAIQTVPLVLVVSSKLPVSNFAELVAYSQKVNGVNFGVSGLGTLAHLALVQIAQQTKLQALQVPYTSATPALNDLLGGHVQAMVDQLNSSLRYIQDGSVKAIAQLGATRSQLLPNVPTLAEQGLPGFSAETFTGIFAPAKLPPAVEQKLVQGMATAMANVALRARFKEMGADMMDMNQAAFTRFVIQDYEKWKRISTEAKIVVE